MMKTHLLFLFGILALGGCDIEFENVDDTGPDNDDDEEIPSTFTATLTSDAVDQEITGSAWFSATSAPTDADPNGSIRQIYLTDEDDNVYTSDWIYIGRGELEFGDNFWREGTSQFGSVAPDQTTYFLDAPLAVVNIGIDGNTNFHFRSQRGELVIDSVDESGNDYVTGSFSIELTGCQGLDCEDIGWELEGEITGTFEAANDRVNWSSDIPEPLN